VRFHITHRTAAAAAEVTGTVMGTLPAVIEQSGLDARLVSALDVDLDWLPYRANFRDPVMVRRAVDAQGALLDHSEMAIDLSQVEPGRFAGQVTEALATLRGSVPSPQAGRVYLDDFGPLRASVIWQFNRLFWQRLADWQRAAGHGSDAVPGDASDANNLQSIEDTVADFWTLLRDLDARGQLPAEIFALEIGVGTGERAAAWLDRFRALDEQCGSGYYGRLRFLLGDYSPATLEAALAAVGRHAPVVSVLALDALNPFKTLAFLRFKILYIHLTDVYGNLPFDEMVRRSERLYLVEARPYVSAAAAERLATEHGRPVEQLPETMRRLVASGPEAVHEDRARGVAFWRCLWDALRLDERLRALDAAEDAHLPSGLSRSHLEDLLASAPPDARFQLSRGAAESFAHTVPLLHPRGFLQVQDTFVTTMEAYRQEFSGPGKVDGAIVSSTNGALLRAVASRAGFDVHFAPFRYRAGSRASVLYTTPRA
jgi:hypothetical protein